MVLAFLMASLLDVIGLGLIMPYISLIIQPETVNSNYISELMEFVGVNASGSDLLVWVGIALIVIFFFKLFTSLTVHWIILKFSFKKGAEIRERLMDIYQQMPYSKYLERNSSEYIHSIQNLSSYFSQMTMPIALRFLSEGIMVSAILAFLAWNNITALAILISLVGAVVFAYDKIFRERITNFGKDTNDFQTKMVQSITEAIDGFREIRILGKDHHFYNKVSVGARKYADAFAKTQILSLAPRFILEFTLILFVVSFVCITIFQQFHLSSIIPTLTVFGVASLRLMPAVNTFSNGIAQLRFTRNATDLLYTDLYEGSKGEKFVSNMEDTASMDFESIELDNVSFSYGHGERNILSDVSLKIVNGESIGIIGNTGSGKTTLINVMLGLLQPAKGEILLNGTPIDYNSRRLRRVTAYLPQNVFLIDDTLRNNVALGLDEGQIEDEKLLSVLRQVRLSGFVDQLPEGLDSKVGQHGMRLSGGQRQRVALARALYHERKLLVMDESTSSLDNDTEQEIIAEFKRLKRDKTMVMIAHRLTTLEHCDRIYKLEGDGTIQKVSYSDLTQVTAS